MAKKAKKKTTKKRKQRSTDWRLGQPLEFPKKRKKPTDFSLVALDVVEAAIGESLTVKKRKKK